MSHSADKLTSFGFVSSLDGAGTFSGIDNSLVGLDARVAKGDVNWSAQEWLLVLKAFRKQIQSIHSKNHSK